MLMSQAGTWGDPRIISYLTLRQAVGFLAILLPFVVAAGDWLIFHSGVQQSLSDYYYTPMRGVLVGGLCVIGAFLLGYNGYNWWDSRFTNAAGIGALGVAVFPTPPPHPSFLAAIAGYIHFASGVVLFTSLIVIALWLFRKTGPDPRRSRLKQLPNAVYLTCGIVMVISLALAGIASLPFAGRAGFLHPVFWLETAAIASFGVSWIVKGQAILRDRQSPTRPVLPD